MQTLFPSLHSFDFLNTKLLIESINVCARVFRSAVSFSVSLSLATAPHRSHSSSRTYILIKCSISSTHLITVIITFYTHGPVKHAAYIVHLAHSGLPMCRSCA